MLAVLPGETGLLYPSLVAMFKRYLMAPQISVNCSYFAYTLVHTNMHKYVPVRTTIYQYILVCSILYMTYCVMYRLTPCNQPVVCVLMPTFLNPADSSFQQKLSPLACFCQLCIVALPLQTGWIICTEPATQFCAGCPPDSTRSYFSGD